MIDFLKNEQKDEEENKPSKPTIKGGKFVQISLGATEIDMLKCLTEYDKLYEKYPDLLTWDIRKLTQVTNIPAYSWRNFLLDSRVQKWIADEQFLQMLAKRNILLNSVGENNSTATVQALTAIMKATDDTTDRLEDNHVYIYSFMPLTNEEERLNNAQVLKSIPDEIRTGMQHITSNKNSNN